MVTLKVSLEEFEFRHVSPSSVCCINRRVNTDTGTRGLNEGTWERWNCLIMVLADNMHQKQIWKQWSELQEGEK